MKSGIVISQYKCIHIAAKGFAIKKNHVYEKNGLMNRICNHQPEVFAEFRRKIEMLIRDFTHSQNISHKLYEELYSNYHIKNTEMHFQQSISDEIASRIRKIIVHEYRNPKWFDMLVTRRPNFQIKNLNISEFVRKELMILIKELPEYYSSILHEIEIRNRSIPEAAELFGLTKAEMEKRWIEARYCLLDLLLKTNGRYLNNSFEKAVHSELQTE